jgi:isocitrate dehydrogenase (NAD+)
MTRAVTLIPGDGIGPEVTAAVVEIVETAGVRIDWDRHDAGQSVAPRARPSSPGRSAGPSTQQPEPGA